MKASGRTCISDPDILSMIEIVTTDKTLSIRRNSEYVV